MTEEDYLIGGAKSVEKLSVEERKQVLWLLIKGRVTAASNPDESIMTAERFRVVINKAIEIKGAYQEEHPGKQMVLRRAILLACETDLERRGMITWLKEARMFH